MEFRPYYLGCLAHASYLIASEGEAAVIDPQRDVEQYLAEAERLGVKIRWVIETHLHADFVSGHRELSQRTGAEIVFGHRAGVSFAHRAVRDGDVLTIGKVRVRILETPGHTLEGISLLIEDETGAPRKLMTGDTLFIGDVGRPDLLGSKGHSSEDMASLLYDTLRDKILPLSDDLEIWPAHGAGSACGRNISNESFSTLGSQRRTNYALQPMSREAFVKAVTADLPAVPPYFSRDVALNREGAPPIESLRTVSRLTASDAAKRLQANALAIDVRPYAAFGEAHIPGSINIGLGGQFAHWAGSLLPFERPLVLVTTNEAEAKEASMRLARVGLHEVAGWITVSDWRDAALATATTAQVSVQELAARREAASVRVLDVRRPAEYEAGHIPGAINLPLDSIVAGGRSGLEGGGWHVACAGGYRSSAACGLLERMGISATNVIGGTSAWVQAGFPTDASTREETA